MESIEALLVEAFQARQHDLPELAAEAFAKAARLDPGDGFILLEIARCQIDLAEPALARETLDRVLRLAESDDELALESAHLWSVAGDPGQALTELNRIPRQSSQFIPATLEMVRLLERLHRLDEAATALATRHPDRSGPPELRFAAALLADRAGDVDHAEYLLRSLWTGQPRSSLDLECGYRLARLLDRSGRTMEALPLLAACKKLEREEMNAALLAEAVERRRKHDLSLLQQLPQDWFAGKTPVHGSSHLFLLGHPRSGTSLMARKLSAATGVGWVDESPAFDAVARSLIRHQSAAAGPAGLLAFLQALSALARAGFREEYSRKATAQLPSRGAVRWFEKNPGLSHSLPALHRLLPESAWLMMLRDPRDTALSCYFQKLGATPLGWSCLTLQGAMDAVHHVLACWVAVRRCLRPDQFLEVRYESLTHDPKTVTAGVIGALGWPSLPEAVGRPSGPLLNTTPSYADIESVVHQRPVGRWRRLNDGQLRPAPATVRLMEELGYEP